MNGLPDDLQPIEESSLQRLARICGGASASARVLADGAEMRARGANPAYGYSPRHKVLIAFAIVAEVP